MNKALLNYIYILSLVRYKDVIYIILKVTSRIFKLEYSINI